MPYFKLLSASFFFIVTASINAQSRDSEAHFSVSGAAGLSWSGAYKWLFETCDRAPIYPNFSFGAGIEYGPVLVLEGTLLFSSLEVSYGRESASKNFESGAIRGAVRQIPVLFWMKVMSETRLSPFARLGAGINQTDYTENAECRCGPSIRFNKWHFIWAAGSGLNYQLTEFLSLEFFIDVWTTEEVVVAKNSYGFNDGLEGKFIFNAFGFRGIMSL